jgi:hypothetical protein
LKFYRIFLVIRVFAIGLGDSPSGLVISLSVCTPLSLPSASGLALDFDLRLFSIGLDWRSLQSGLTTVFAIDLRVASLQSLLSSVCSPSASRPTLSPIHLDIHVFAIGLRTGIPAIRLDTVIGLRPSARSDLPGHLCLCHRRLDQRSLHPSRHPCVRYRPLDWRSCHQP